MIKQWCINFYKAPCFWIKFLSATIIIGLAAFGLFKIVSSALYYFNEPLTYFDPERLGQLGDFLGGTLNPIFGFATVCLLLWSVFIQRKEFDLTRRELRNQANISKSEYNRKQLESTIEDIQKTYNKILNEKFPKILIKYKDATDTQFSQKEFSNLNELMLIMAHKKGPITHPKNILSWSNETTSETIYTANITLKLMINLFEDLIAITKKESVIEYWRLRAKTQIDQACSISILDINEKDQLYRKIGVL